MLPALIGLATTAAAAASAAGFQSMSPTGQWFGPTFAGGIRGSRQIALTYDDGPNDPHTLKLLDVLAKHSVRATFFMIGRYVQQRPDIARAVAEAGHVIGNHTNTHPRPVPVWKDRRVQNFSAKRPSVVVSRIQKTFLVLRTPDRANGQALWMPSCFARKESAPYSNRKLIPQFACNGRSHGLAARRAGYNPRSFRSMIACNLIPECHLSKHRSFARLLPTPCCQISLLWGHFGTTVSLKCRWPLTSDTR